MDITISPCRTGFRNARPDLLVVARGLGAGLVGPRAFTSAHTAGHSANTRAGGAVATPAAQTNPPNVSLTKFTGGLQASATHGPWGELTTGRMPSGRNPCGDDRAIAAVLQPRSVLCGIFCGSEAMAVNLIPRGPTGIGRVRRKGQVNR